MTTLHFKTALVSRGEELQTKLNGLIDELINNNVSYNNVREKGAKGDGVTDDTDNLQSCFNMTIGKTVYIPDGVYPISRKLLLPETVDLIMSPNARILATTTMDKMIETPANVYIDHGTIQGGILDCNDMADIGLHVRYAQGVEVGDIMVQKSRITAFKMGAAEAISSSYEIMMYGCNSHRPNNSVCLAGSAGLYLENCSDSHFVNCVFVGNETGVYVSGGNNHFWGVHVWNRPTSGQMKYGFDVQGSGHFTNCVADTPTVYGWYLHGYNDVLVNCRVFMGIWGPTDASHPDSLWDNTTIGIYYLNDFHSFIGCFFFGTPTSRLLQDIYLTPGKPNVTISGSQFANVTTHLGNRFTDLYIIGNATIDGSSSFNGSIIAKNGSNIRSDGNEGDVGRSWYMQTYGSTKWRVGSDGGTAANDAGLSFNAYQDGGGSIEKVWMNRQTGEVQFRKKVTLQDQVNMAGTWDKPLYLNSIALWVSSEKLYIKAAGGVPTSANDGIVVGTQT